MPSHDPARDRITEHLQDAIVGMREQLRRVELWAAALEGFSRPVPGAEPAARHRLPPSARLRNGSDVPA